MRRRYAAALPIALVALIVTAALLVRSQAASDLLCGWLEAEGARRLDGTVRIAACRLNPLRARLELQDLVVESPARGLVLRAEAAAVRVREFHRIADAFALRQVVLERPRLELTLPESEPGVEAACRIPELPIEILEAVVRDGRVRVRRGGLEARVEGLDLSVRRSGVRRAVAVGTRDFRLTHGERAWSGSGLALQGTWDDGVGRADVELLTADLDGLDVGFAGRAVDPCAPRLDGELTVSGALARLMELTAGPEPARTARGTISGKVRLGGLALRPEGEVELEVRDGALRRFVLGNARIRARWDGAGVDLKEVRTDAAGGSLSVTGRVDLASGLPARLDVRADDLTLEGLVEALGVPGSWAGAGLETRGRLRGSLHPLELTGRATARVDRFQVLTRAVDRGAPRPDELVLRLPRTRLEGDLRVTARSIFLDDATVRLPGSRARVSGELPLDDERPLDLSAVLEEVRLEELERIAGVPLAGAVTGTAHVGGPYADVEVEARVQGRGLVVAGLEAGVATGRVDYRDMVLSTGEVHGQRGRSAYTLAGLALRFAPEVTFETDVQVADGRVEDVVAALEGFHPVAARFAGAQGRIGGSFRVAGPVAAPSMWVDATAEAGTFQGQALDRLRVRGRVLEARRWELDEGIVALAEGGRLTARGWAVEDGEVALSVSARAVPLEAVAGVAATGLAGRLSGDVVLQGPWARPQGAGALAWVDGAWHGRPLQAGRLRVALAGTRLTVDGSLDGGRVTGGGWLDLVAPASFGLDVVFREDDPARWLRGDPQVPVGLARMTGAAHGRLRVQGPLADPGALSGEVSFERLEARFDQAWVELATPVQLALDRGAIRADGLRVRGPGSELRIAGTRGRGGRLDGTLRGTAGLSLLEAFVPVEVNAGGSISLEATVAGTFEAPLLLGSARMRDGAVGLPGAGLAISDLEGRIAFSQNRVVLEDLVGTFGRGRLVLGGEVALRRFLPGRMRLAARLEEVRLNVPENLRSVVSGELWLDRGDDTTVPPLLSGELDVLRARYRAEFAIDELLAGVAAGAGAAPASRPPVLRMDVGLHAPGTVVVDNRNLRATLRADLRVTGTDVRPSLIGTLSVLEGRADFRGNEFLVSHALVDFKDRERIDPTFDVHAESEVRDYRVFVHAFGTAQAPRLTLTSDPDLSETDLVTLLTLGVTTRDAAGLSGGDAAAAAADALFALSGLDRQVRAFIPANPILRDPSLRLTSGYSRGSGQVEPRLAFESRVLVDDLRLRYSAPLGVPGQRTQAEYRLTSRVSLQAEWDTETRESAVGNVGLDLKLRWEAE